MGVTVWGAGVVDFTQEGVGLVTVFLDEDDDGLVANETNIVNENGQEDSGMLDNLIGPVKEALQTVAGGTVIAAFGAIDKLLGFYAWPVTTAKTINAPREIIALSGAMVVSFTFGVIRVFKASV